MSMSMSDDRWREKILYQRVRIFDELGMVESRDKQRQVLERHRATTPGARDVDYAIDGDYLLDDALSDALSDPPVTDA